MRASVGTVGSQNGSEALQPLADALLKDPTLDPEQVAETYLNIDLQITHIKDALDGAKQILMERFSLAADLLAELRHLGWQDAQWQTQVVDGKEQVGVVARVHADETIIPFQRR